MNKIYITIAADHYDKKCRRKLKDNIIHPDLDTRCFD